MAKALICLRKESVLGHSGEDALTEAISGCHLLHIRVGIPTFALTPSFLAHRRHHIGGLSCRHVWALARSIILNCLDLQIVQVKQGLLHFEVNLLIATRYCFIA